MSDFVRGTFVAYRAVTKFHVGSITTDVLKDDEVEFDGQVLRLGGTDHNVPQIRSVIKTGWLVPVADTTSVYRPATTNRTVKAVHDEDRDLGKIKDVRDRGDGTPKRRVIEEAGSSEGVEIGKIKTAAVQKTTLTAENASRVSQEINRIDNAQGASSPVVVPTAKMPIVVAGDDYSDIIPQQRQIKVPSGNGGEGNMPHLTPEERAAKVEAARGARTASSTPVKAPPVQEPVSDLELDLGFEEAPAAPAEDPRMAVIRMAVPNFAWDLTLAPAARVKLAVEKHGKDLMYVNGILAIEAPNVKAAIMKGLSASAKPAKSPKA